MITAASLKTYTLKDLAQLARKSGVVGWHTMRKDQLIRALEKSSKQEGAKSPKAGRNGSVAGKALSTKASVGKPMGGKEATKSVGKSVGKAGVPKIAAAKKSASRSAAAKATAAKIAAAKVIGGKVVGGKVVGGKVDTAKVSTPKSAVSKSSSVSRKGEVAKGAPAKPKNPQVARKIQRVNEERERRRDLSQPPVLPGGKTADVVKDRIVLLVRDPYWLQATWEVTRQSVQRVQAAMAELWHAARPILRLMEVENTGTTSSAERVLREIPIHGGVHNWYIDVQDPPRGFRVELGYLATSGRFFPITRSNTVTTPRPGSADSLDENWSDVEQNFEKIFAQSGGYSEETSSHELQEAFEERLQRPIGPPLASRFGVGAERMLRRKRDFQFDVDAEMVVHGQTKPDAHVTLSGEPVKLREDGSFAVRMALPDKRQVIPVVASSRDGVEQRTIVIAVERNTKVMEPMIRESND